MTAVSAIENPFPGLRSFETEQSHLFHGRKEQSEELVRLLGKHRFLAVVGSSGCGKSSLVKAGLLPRLYRGYLSGATSRWRITLLRPGAHPIAALADAVRRPKALALGASSDEIAARLQTSSLGLVDVVRDAQLPDGESLLVVVDQFEEVFRFRRESRAVDEGREAALFVNLLVAAAQFEVPIYIVLTMRSDFLGDCAQFPSLPEALNQAQYLVPRLSREQREQAIIIPLETAGAEITPALTQLLLNDAGDDPDQLPALQHSLMRLWEAGKGRGIDGPLDAQLYTPERQVGRSLESHANALFHSLSDDDQRLAALLFRCITTVEDGHEVRRPAKLGHIYAVLGVVSAKELEHVRAVIRLYAAPENSLLLSSTGAELGDETIIDITHESLIRQWSVLKDWVKLEAESAEWLSRLVRSAELHREGKAGYWGNPDAQFAWKRSTEDAWNPAWASQYREGFGEAMTFLRASRELIDLESQEEEERRQKELQTAQALIEAERKNARAERSGRLRLAFAAAALAMAVAGLVWLTIQLQREKTNALRLSLLSRAAEERALVAENRAKAEAAQTHANQAKGAERELLRKEAQQFNDQADEIARKASRPDFLPPASDAVLKQIKDLRAQLARADEDNRKLRNELRQTLAAGTKAITPTGAARGNQDHAGITSQVQFLPADTAANQFGLKISRACEVLWIRITNPGPSACQIVRPRITRGGRFQNFTIVREQERIKKDVLWIRTDIVPQNTTIDIYWFASKGGSSDNDRRVAFEADVIPLPSPAKK